MGASIASVSVPSDAIGTADTTGRLQIKTPKSIPSRKEFIKLRTSRWICATCNCSSRILRNRRIPPFDDIVI